MGEPKRTPLLDKHRQSGAKMIEFHGWLLPVEYGEITREVRATREQAGLFDVCHMGRILVRGRRAPGFLDRLFTSDLSALPPGKARYGFFLNERGGTVDDLLVYSLGGGQYWLVVNAANREKDLRWLKEQAGQDVEIWDQSGDFGQLALQGPDSPEVLQALAGGDVRVHKLPPFSFIPDLDLGNNRVLASRTGYTGEDGFELYCRKENLETVWDLLVEDQPRTTAVKPVGLGARDVLRLEAGLPLYGQELDEEITPLEAGLERFVAWEKPSPFVGRDALAQQKARGVPVQRVGLQMEHRGVPRHGYRVESQGEDLGWVSSGTHSPTLGCGIGMAFLQSGRAQEGETVQVLVRGKPREARVTKIPFVRRSK